MFMILILIMLVILIAAPCITLLSAGPNPDDLEYIGNNRYKHKRTGKIYYYDHDRGTS